MSINDNEGLAEGLNDLSKDKYAYIGRGEYRGIHYAYSKSFTSSMVKPVISAIMSHANP